MRLIILLATLVLLVPAVASAEGGCEFNPTRDAKVFSYTYPATVGLDGAVLSFEVGLTEWGSKGCLNGTVDIFGALRLIPWLRDVLPPEPSPSSLELNPFQDPVVPGGGGREAQRLPGHVVPEDRQSNGFV